MLAICAGGAGIMPNLKSMLEYEEGRRYKPYKCSEGFWTYGIGHKMTSDELKTCATRTEVSDSAIDRMFESDKQKAINAASKYGWFKNLNEPRQAVVISMIFQMGEAGFSKFQMVREYLLRGEYIEAASEMLDSRWAKQTPNRAKRHARQMRTGEWCKEYAANVTKNVTT